MFRQLVLAALAVHAAASVYPGSILILMDCSETNTAQQLSLQASGEVTTPDGSLCVTYTAPSPAALSLEPCTGSAAQNWTFVEATGVFEGAVGPSGECLAWNAQGGDSSVRALGLVERVCPCVCDAWRWRSLGSCAGPPRVPWSP